MGYDILGDSGVLRGLADAQTSHRNQFDSILGDITSSQSTVLGKWEGAGWDEKDSNDKSFRDYYEQAQEAFNKLIQATDVNADTWGQLASRMPGYFDR